MIRRTPLLILLLLCVGYLSKAQTNTNLSGTLSLEMTRVTSVNTGSVFVDDPSGFTTGDLVLLIQMQGAVINLTNSSSFGNITDLNGAGSYEVATICEILGSEIRFESLLGESYANSGVSEAGIQLIKIPQYEDVTITGTLTAPAWDGTTGGVLIFLASGAVTLNADIDMSGKGFRGGEYEDMNINDGFPICFSIFGSPKTEFDDYSYSLANQDGAKKGEGIANFTINEEYGRGKQANGGGGGNEHDAGGGGGGNYGTGGQGSEQVVGNCDGSSPGVGGLSLSGLGYSIANNRLFMGGGGGAGFSNNDVISDPGDLDFPGGAGGGIIWIIANQIAGNTQNVLADGESIDIGGAPGNDGASGGGAGGTILIQTNAITSSLIASVTGGDGTPSNSTGSNCAGPGGGGGGGVVWSSAVFANLTTSVAGGAGGTDLDAGCSGSTATAGGNGTAFTNFSPNFSTSSNSGCVLPVRVSSFEGEVIGEAIRLTWRSDVEVNHRAYRIERQDAAQLWQTLGEVEAMGEITHYEWVDALPLAGSNRYRLAFVGQGGAVSYSSQVDVRYQPSPRLSLFHVTAADGAIQGRVHFPQQMPWTITIQDLRGQSLQRENFSAAWGVQAFAIPATAWPSGVYLVTVEQGGQRMTRRVMRP